MTLVLVVLVSYLLGSIPFSFLASKLKGKDPRTAGTGNVGASNTLIVAGKRAGVIALLGDVGKAYLAIYLAQRFALPSWGIALAALAVVVGHDFPIFLKFKGGKGVATTGGILIALDPLFTVLIVLFWTLSMVLIRYFIPATCLTMIIIPIMMWMGSWRLEYIAFGLANALLSLYAHRADLQRFFAGKELTIQESMAKHLKK
ncbi:MAG: glycerol-3-phosphate 1-O-acyltransferase PlsY [Candidatus Margulisbacteria bacterium]|nr:glycerol-3-phosphate 1-O-acyltransferase PlsY [Candidatus Margulisiibacteriota bacterium]